MPPKESTAPPAAGMTFLPPRIRGSTVTLLILVILPVWFPSRVECGPYVPFDPDFWTLPAINASTTASNFKIHKFYEGPSLGLSSEYGNLPKSRSLAKSELSKVSGRSIVYVSTRGAASQSIYALVDRRGRGVADYAFKILSFPRVLPEVVSGAPLGIAWNADSTNGTLYVLVSSYWDANRLYKVVNIDQYAMSRTPVPEHAIELIRDDFPVDSWHGVRYIRFDKDKNLYVAIGANCNACNVYGQSADNGSYYNKEFDADMTNVHNYYRRNASTAKYQFASIYKFAPPYTATTSPGVVLYASGVRNSVGFDINPSNGYLYFTDNGRDDIGGANSKDPAVVNVTRNSPDCEFNYVSKAGSNFGFPYCHTGAAGPNEDNADYYPYRRLPGIDNDIVDPDLNANQSVKVCNGESYVRAIQAMGPHTAPLGMRWYVPDAHNAENTNFPSEYWYSAFIAQHGSWNRDVKIGARVMRVQLESASTVAKYDAFLSGGVPCDVGSPDGLLPCVSELSSLKQTLPSWIGRPVDVEELPDTTLLVSDDEMGAVYRVVYCDPLKPAWGSNAPYGVGRCGGKSRLPTTDTLTVKPLTPFDDISQGCQVNLGPHGKKSYRRCFEYDSTQRGTITQLAYSLQAGANNTVILDGAFLAQDYAQVNGKGWVAWGTPLNGLGDLMAGTNALIITPTANGSDADVSVQTLDSGSAVAGLDSTSGFILEGTQPIAALAGGAVVTAFQAVLPARFSPTAGGNLSAIITFGDVTATGELGQPWVINVANLLVNPSDLGVSPPPSSPMLN